MSINVYRRRFLGSLSLITASLALPDFVYALPTLEDFVIAQTTYGKVRGINNKGVAVFRGIPYAGRCQGIGVLKDLHLWKNGQRPVML
jgi:para-nitrobenzyl esterase